MCGLSSGRWDTGYVTESEFSKSCHNSRIHESRSSTPVCARALSGGLLGARGVGAVSAARASACLSAVRTRSCANARNSVVSGGFLPTQKSTSYNLEVGRHGPAEDLRPVSEVEARGQLSARR